MTIADGGFSGRTKEEYLAHIKERMKNSADEETVFRHIWEGSFDGKWEFRREKYGRFFLRIYLHAFAEMCSLPLRRLIMAIFRLDSIGVIHCEMDADGKFYFLGIAKEGEKFSLTRAIASRNLRSSAAGRSTLSRSRKDNNSNGRKGEKNPISAAEMEFAAGLGFDTATIKTCWKIAETRQAFWDALEMAYERKLIGDELCKYANWAVHNPRTVQNYFESRRAQKGLKIVKENLEILYKLSPCGTRCISINYEKNEAHVNLLSGVKVFDLEDKKLREKFEKIIPEFTRTEDSLEGKCPRKKIDLDAFKPLPRGRLTPPPPSGSPSPQVE